MSTELYIPRLPKKPSTDYDPKTGRFLKGHVSHNKGKKWNEYMSKSAQRRARKGWKNLDLHRNKNGRPDTAGRCRKPVIGITNDGQLHFFDYIGAAGTWCGGNRENVGRCCRINLARLENKKTGKVNTDHAYNGIRWYFESDPIWMSKMETSNTRVGTHHAKRCLVTFPDGRKEVFASIRQASSAVGIHINTLLYGIKHNKTYNGIEVKLLDASSE